jgi:glycosyltransferase involved in cell wall biosynthesis
MSAIVECDRKNQLMIETPLVSICIPTYNGSSYLDEAFASIKAQTYTNLEVVISDDNSKDDTIALCKSFKEQIAFPVKIVAHTPNGIGANWNNTIKLAKGVFIKFLFQDDVLEPNCIKAMVQIMQRRPDLGLVACKRGFIVEGETTPSINKWIETYGNLQRQFEKDEAITIIDEKLFKQDEFIFDPRNKIGEPPTVLFKKAIIKEVGFFDEDLKQILDYVFYYRILKKYPIAIINKPLVKFRIHPAQATNINRAAKISDYDDYDRILYKEFLPLLHKTQQQRLKMRFSKGYNLQRRVINKLKHIFGK